MSNRLRWTWKVVALTAVVLVAAGGTVRADKVLRLKFKPGQTLRMTMEQVQQQTVKAGQAPVAITVTMTMDITTKIDAVDEKGVASVTMTIDRVQMKMSGPQGMGFEYDSASGKPPEGQIGQAVAPMFEALVKKAFTYKLDPQAKVSEMKLPQGLVDALNKSGGGQMFSEDVFKQMTGLGTVALPDKAVKVGDTWSGEATVAMPMLGTMKVTNSYRYDGTEKRDGKELDKIGNTVAMEIVPAKDKPQPFQMKISDQKTEGTIYFDNEAGQVVEVKSKSKMKIAMDVAGQQIEQDIEITSTLRQLPPQK